VKPKRTPFAWATNINESTIEDIKNAIIKKWPDIDDVNEATLAFITGTDSFVPADDSALRTTLKAMVVTGTKTFSVSLEMCIYI
jgi:hypothetical protein